MRYRIYGDTLSGNCYKIKLLLHWLELEYEWIHVDVLGGETQHESFLALNRNAKIPVMVIMDGDNETILTESNAILNFLATGSSLLPDEPLLRAQVLEWQFFEQYSHEPFIAVARYISKYLGLPEDRKADYESKQEGGCKALSVMDRHLETRCFFVNEQPTIADISLYAYTHVADEGGFSLSPYPNIQKWLRRIEQLPNYIALG